MMMMMMMMLIRSLIWVCLVVAAAALCDFAYVRETPSYVAALGIMVACSSGPLLLTPSSDLNSVVTYLFVLRYAANPFLRPLVQDLSEYEMVESRLLVLLVAVTLLRCARRFLANGATWSGKRALLEIIYLKGALHVVAGHCFSSITASDAFVTVQQLGGELNLKYITHALAFFADLSILELT